jgi:5-methylcytosine-specific restriction endonuclease McrA
METQKRYAKENPEMMRTHALAYRARKHAARGAVTAAEFTAITERQKFRCHWCGNSIRSAPTMDHVIPLSKGGEHSVANVVASCRRCNSKKKDKDPIAWANELGRLF